MFGLLFLFGILNAVVQGCSVPRVTQGSGAPIGSDLVLNSGSVLHLICEGDCPVTWVPRLAKHKNYNSKKIRNTKIFLVNKVDVEFTGTYKCVYINKNASNTMASVHVFVRDPGALFVSPNFRRLLSKEGKDLVLPCLLTDPNATDFTLRMDNGTAVPYGMNMTFDPRKGVLIHNVQPGFNADYVCSARIGGVEKVSKIFSLNIIERLRFPPYVFLKQNKYVRLVGERFQISCSTNNPNFDYNITWTNSSRTLLHGNERSTIEGERMAIESILTIPSLQLSDSGNITCTGQNEAGANSSTAQLLVVDKPYIRLWPKLSTKLSHQGLSITVSEGDDVDLGVLIEAYPPLTFHHWKTPTSHNASLPESSFYSDNDRYEAMLFLKRLKYEETGFYTLYLQSRMRNASITFHIKMSNTFFTSAMYGSTVAIVVLALLLIFMIYKYKQLATDYKNVHSERMFIRSDSGISSNCSESYLDMRSTTERVMHSDLDSSSECQEENFWSLDLDDLVRFACQVAQGLEFLSANNTFRYELMQMCWRLDAAERPTFSKISQMLQRMLGDDPMVQRMLGDGIEIQETEYQNVQSEPRDEQPESRDPIKQDEQLQETLCEREEDQPLITPNNYQFC
ncbi:hypothetical protein DNTS_030144 [Danionella cerebrum]|uniref:Platelet-derived growth factor receptor-like protein n=1 Tax=Danionella cerebrum TaxID=2873325 RepID=A0A553QMX6_9TELE|nr:hypothetical protein DNTS_030144 [Danionella translucida]